MIYCLTLFSEKQDAAILKPSIYRSIYGSSLVFSDVIDESGELDVTHRQTAAVVSAQRHVDLQEKHETQKRCVKVLCKTVSDSL